jgi:hypothetical protein
MAVISRTGVYPYAVLLSYFDDAVNNEMGKRGGWNCQ